MSSIPAHPTGPSSASGATSAAAKAKPAPPLASSRKWILIGSTSAIIILVLLAWFLIHSMGQTEPRLNENTIVLSKFISNSSTFSQLPFEKQRQYYKVMDDRDTEIDQAFEQSQLTEGEYRAALEAAWLGKHINRFEKYAAMSPSARANYVNTLLNDKDKKDQKKGKSKKGQSKTPSPDKIKVDETAAELRVESWPPPVRDQWKQFHDAYHREKKSREEKAAAAASKPSS